MSITGYEWFRVVADAEDILDEYEGLSSDEEMSFALEIELLLLCYRMGERTKELYKQLLAVE